LSRSAMMKISCFISAIFVTVVAAAPHAAHEKRQGSTFNVALGLVQSVANTQKKEVLSTFATKKLKPDLFQHATREKSIWGPFTLQAANVNQL